MTLTEMECPNCGQVLECEDGLDTFYCKYCGNKIVLGGMSSAAYDAKIEMQKLKYEQIKYENENKKEAEHEKNSWKAATVAWGILLLFFAVAFSLIHVSHVKEENRLNTIVEEVKKNIKNNEFDEAYSNATLIRSDNDKWDEIREDLMKRIEAKEEAVTGKTTHKEEPATTEEKGFLEKMFDD